MKQLLTLADITRAANTLGVSVPALQAVLAVEAPRGGFQTDGQVSILFERHYFSRLTGGKYDASHSDISNRTAGGYGAYSIQHAKLQRAAALDRDAALQSASWGKPQIMGENWKQAGARSLQDFINRMSAGEPQQLDLLVNYIRNETRTHNGVSLLAALRSRNWAVFARIYNGPAYAKNQYDVKLADEYRKHGGK